MHIQQENLREGNFQFPENCTSISQSSVDIVGELKADNMGK